MKPAPLATALAYAAFAAVATGVNLGTQRLAHLAVTGPAADLLALAAGTAAGLLAKFLLDARFIFSYRPPRLADGVGRFVAYTGTGIVTTAVFWSVELAWIRIVGGAAAPYVGGALGLAAGYTLKFILDRRFVFRQPGISGRRTPPAGAPGGD